MFYQYLKIQGKNVIISARNFIGLWYFSYLFIIAHNDVGKCNLVLCLQVYEHLHKVLNVLQISPKVKLACSSGIT